MAGHSKWSKVKHFKGAIDAKRARAFAKLSREITVTARTGGGDADMNARLRMVLLKCRSANMPADNIERAIKKGTGAESGAAFEELTYEVFGPHGVAFLIELSTDNRNRTAAEVRHILGRNGGTMATSGAVTRLFERKGHLLVDSSAASEDEMMEAALEAGAEDFKTDENGYEILTAPADFEQVLQAIEGKGVKCASAEVTYLPTLTVPIQETAAAEAVTKLVDRLEDHDDVQEVFINAEMPDG